MTALLLVINVLALFLLIFSYAAWYVSPVVFPEIALLGLAYPYILLVNLVFVVIWLFYKPKYMIFSLILILLGWNHIGRLFQIGGSRSAPYQENDITMLSFNIQNFIKYNTSSTKYLTDFENEDMINDFVTTHQADIVCLQEVLNDRENHRDFIHGFGRKINCPNTYFRNYYRTSKDKVDAIAIFSRFPILKSGYLEFDEKTIAIYTDLKIREDTIRVYNLHLASIHFKQEDLDFISELSGTQEQETIKAGTRNVITKLMAAFEKRGRQADVIAKHMEFVTYPLVICGDFNDTPASYVYRKIAGSRQDAFVEKGSGFGVTYAGETIPAFRIDYILFDQAFSIRDFNIHDVLLSDHYPLSATFSLNK